MSTSPPTIETEARAFARTAGEGFRASADYLSSLPEEQWRGPTGCSKWTVRDLAGHIVGEAVWFANLARGVTVGEAQLPMDVYETLKSLPPPEMASSLRQAADAIVTTIDDAIPEQLYATVDMGWTQMPLWQATSISASEATVHNWDLIVGRDPRATIPALWAAQLAKAMPEFAPFLASGDSGVEGPVKYLLHVEADPGPVTVTVTESEVIVERGAIGIPDLVLHLTPDQFVRLLWGRLPLADAMQRGDVAVEGDESRAQELNRIFRGVGGG